MATWAIITTSQTSPAVTCSPWQPTSVKKAERNALRCGIAPMRDHAGELADLEREERGPEHEGDEGRPDRCRRGAAH